MDELNNKNLVGTTIDSLRELQRQQNEGQMNQIQENLRTNTINKESKESKIDDFDIEELTKDINDNIQDESFLSTEEEDKSSYIPIGWKEPLLLLFIYLLLSQSIVKQFIGKYIPQLNPGSDGTVGFFGVLIYGILLVVIYFASKKLLII